MKTRKERLVQTNEATTLPKTRHVIHAGKEMLDKQTKTSQTCVMEVKAVKGPQTKCKK